jgi:hypothetical protein
MSLPRQATLSLLLVAAGGTALAFAPTHARTPRTNALSDFHSAIAPSPAGAALWSSWIELRLGAVQRIAWNPHTGLPERLYPRGLRLPADQDLAAWLTDLVNDLPPGIDIDADHLRLESSHRGRLGLDMVDFSIVIDGARVLDSRAAAARRGDRIVSVALELLPGAVSAAREFKLTPAAAEAAARRHLQQRDPAYALAGDRTEKVIAPLLANGTTPSPRPAYLIHARRPGAAENLRLLIDGADGSLLDLWDANRYLEIQGSISGMVYPEYGDEPGVDLPLPHTAMEIIGQGTGHTDLDGFFSVPVDGPGTYSYKTKLRGLYAKADEFAAIDPKRTGSVAGGAVIAIDWDGSKAEKDQRNGYYQATDQHDYINAIDPDFTGTDYQMNVRVGIPLMDNAFWDGLGINFGEGFVLFRNLAEYSDVVRHEYTHGTTDKLYGLNGPSGAMHEGFSDYWACTANDDPLVGEHMMKNGDPYMRIIANDKVYPDDLVGEVHTDGEIISGAMWDTRLALGQSLADSLLHYARYLKARRMDLFGTDVLLTDDDDGDLNNGTPHGSRIIQAFSHHGLLPPLALTIEVPTPPAPVARGGLVEWDLRLTNGDNWDQEIDLWVEAGSFITDLATDVAVAQGQTTLHISGRVPAAAPAGEIALFTRVGIASEERHIAAASTSFTLTITP